jgi:hypothetical protein
MFNKWQTSARLGSKSTLYRGIAALPVTAALLVLGAPADVRAAVHVTEFDNQPVLSAAELDKLRGGFDLGNGITVNLGLQVQQFVNSLLTPVNQLNVSVTNKLTVTQTTNGPNGPTTTTLPSIPSTITPIGPINNGATNLAVTLANSGITSTIQNSANNQALTQITTLNISTQGLVNVLHQMAGNSQMIQMIQMNSGIHH